MHVCVCVGGGGGPQSLFAMIGGCITKLFFVCVHGTQRFCCIGVVILIDCISGDMYMCVCVCVCVCVCLCFIIHVNYMAWLFFIFFFT